LYYARFCWLIFYTLLPWAAWAQGPNEAAQLRSADSLFQIMVAKTEAEAVDAAFTNIWGTVRFYPLSPGIEQMFRHWAEEAATSANHHLKLGLIYYLQSHLYEMHERLEFRDEYAAKALSHAARINWPQLTYNLNREVGYFFYKRKQYDSAQVYFGRALAQLGQVNVEMANSEAAPMHNTMGMVYRQLGQYDKAIPFFEQTLVYARQTGQTAYLGIASGNLGYIYLQQGKLDEAYQAYLTDRHYCLASEEYENAAEAFWRLGIINTRRQRYAQAKQQLDSALAVSGLPPTRLGGRMVRLRAEVYRQLAEVLNAEQKYAQAYQAAYQQNLRLDTLRKGDEQTLAAQSAGRMEFERQQAEIIRLNLTVEAQRRQQIWLATVLSVGTLLVLTLAWLAWRQRQLNRLLALRNNEVNQQKNAIESQNQVINQQNLALTQANAAKDKLFSAVSHDLLTPVGNMRNVLELLTSQELTPAETKLAMEQLQRDFSLLAEMMANLLQWASAQLRGIQTKPQTLHAKDLVDETLRFYHSMAHNKGIALLNGIAPVAVTADRDQMRLILRNLINNAVKFTSRGGRVQVSARREGGQAWFTVADTGVGISPDNQAQLFNLDTRFSRLGTANERGAGLGLLLVKEFVEANGGQLQVASQPGQGSQFSFSLPLAG
jgi:signal transduction histidine kinase